MGGLTGALMENHYILYGSYASYYTAKTRSYLRKKGIAFVERLPSDPQFRERVRPASGSHRIPQLLTPLGEVIQDSVAIQDYLEAGFPALPAIPATPAQRLFVHLMELLASEGLLQLAWMHRWLFEEQNYHFVKMEFGRSFKPQGTDEELMKYGNLIADRMLSRGQLPEATAELKAQLDEQLLGLLAVLERHFTDLPYLLGGHPSAADYAMMGALHAHMGRDPAGLHLMQRHAPRVFRWVEHMLMPEVQSPEFFDCAIEYPAADQIATTALAVLQHIADNFGEPLLLSALAFNQATATVELCSGHSFNPDLDQPQLPEQLIDYDGSRRPVRANVHNVWLLQRSQVYFRSLEFDCQQRMLALFGDGVASELLSVPLTVKLKRQDNRIVVA